jgi:predicted amidophosphoribosyltransferase
MFFYRCDGCGSRVRASCDRCLVHVMSLRSADINGVIVAMPYSGVARRLMIGYKYRNHREVAGCESFNRQHKLM